MLSFKFKVSLFSVLIALMSILVFTHVAASDENNESQEAMLPVVNSDDEASSTENMFLESQSDESENLFNDKTFELYPEVYHYKYTEVIGVKDEGWKYGLVASATRRIHENQPISSWRDIINKNYLVNVFKAEVRGSYGLVDYTGSGTQNNIPDYNIEGRLSVGLDIPFNERFRVTPFAGFGYRYLYNKFSVAPAKIIDGKSYYSGYDRESHYWYLPFGMESDIVLHQGWSINLRGEYDLLIKGKQLSHFEDEKDLSGDQAGYDTLSNVQRNGMGYRFSARLLKQSESIDIFTEGFVRYWHIKDSEVGFVTLNGQLLCDENDLCDAGLEPNNKTWEIGFNAGIKF